MYNLFKNFIFKYPKFMHHNKPPYDNFLNFSIPQNHSLDIFA